MPSNGVVRDMLLETCCADATDAISVSIVILTNHAPRAHHASTHVALSATGLSDICLCFLN